MKRVGSIEELARITFPTVYEVNKTKLEREARLQTNSETFDPAAREKALMQVFLSAAGYFQYEQRRVGTRILVNGLHPLQPTEDEIRKCLTHFRDGRHAIGSLRSAELLRLVQRREITTDKY